MTFKTFALWTMRSALEHPGVERVEMDQPFTAYLQAAAAWIEVCGPQIYRWDDVYPHGLREGAPGRGGPLWQGAHGFCSGRWRLWRERFGQIAGEQGFEPEMSKAAERAEIAMRDIETKAGHETEVGGPQIV